MRTRVRRVPAHSDDDQTRRRGEVARILPFRAVRYTHVASGDLSSLVAPPYDVVTPSDRAALLSRDAHNVIALDLPDGPADPAAPGNRYEAAARLWREWLDEGTLGFDAAPAIYVVEQRFELHRREAVRRGFVAAVGVEPFSTGAVLPHERTLPRALDDRLNLIRATAANVSPVFGLFSDPTHATDALIAAAMADAPIETATLDGVASTVWALRDAASHAALAAFLDARPVYIADGHHRYTTALTYSDERRAAAAGAAGATERPRADRPYDSVMMLLVNMDDPGLVVLPTHRVADAPDGLDAERFWSRFSERFELADLPDDRHATAVLAASADRPSYLVRTKDGTTRLARLRYDVDLNGAFPEGASGAWRALDVAVLQELVLSPLLDIHPDRPKSLDRLTFVKDARQALEMAGKHDVAFVLNATRMEQVAAVAMRGETMPQKSTYFHPKVPSGLLFKSLDVL
jgi:uncharacterized protein (DUF1015 family)